MLRDDRGPGRGGPARVPGHQCRAQPAAVHDRPEGAAGDRPRARARRPGAGRHLPLAHPHRAAALADRHQLRQAVAGRAVADRGAVRGGARGAPVADRRWPGARGRAGNRVAVASPADPLVCPGCGRQYGGRRRFCVGCGLPLAPTGAPDLTDVHRRARKVKPQLSEGRLMRVAGAANQPEAEFIQALLLEEGIPSVLRRSAGFDVPDFLAAGPRDVLVPASGVVAARQVLMEAELVPQADPSVEGELPTRGEQAARGEQAMNGDLPMKGDPPTRGELPTRGALSTRGSPPVRPIVSPARLLGGLLVALAIGVLIVWAIIQLAGY